VVFLVTSSGVQVELVAQWQPPALGNLYLAVGGLPAKVFSSRLRMCALDPRRFSAVYKHWRHQFTRIELLAASFHVGATAVLVHCDVPGSLDRAAENRDTVIGKLSGGGLGFVYRTEGYAALP
jgi:hypothetical protein